MRTGIAIALLALVGCQKAGPVGGPATAVPAGPVVVVTATYLRASAPVIAETLADPVENQISGCEGMTRMESRSRNDGGYTAYLYFRPDVAGPQAVALVQNRVALAAPILPESVRQGGVTVKLGTAEAAPNEVVVVVAAPQDRDWPALKAAADAVVNALAAKDAAAKWQASTRESPHLSVAVDRAKCVAAGVAESDIWAFDPSAKTADELRKTVVGNSKVTVGDIATVTEPLTPVEVRRVNLHPAVRIVGRPASLDPAACVVHASFALTVRGAVGYTVYDCSAK